MPIPWLIGAAVVWAGKGIYDAYKENEREEQAERKRAKAKRDEAKKRKEANLKEKNRLKKEQEKLLKNYTETQAKILLDKHKITRLMPTSLASSAMSDPDKAIADTTKGYMESKVRSTLNKNVTSLEKELDDIAELEQVIKGL